MPLTPNLCRLPWPPTTYGRDIPATKRSTLNKTQKDKTRLPPGVSLNWFNLYSSYSPRQRPRERTVSVCSPPTTTSQRPLPIQQPNSHETLHTVPLAPRTFTEPESSASSLSNPTAWPCVLVVFTGRIAGLVDADSPSLPLKASKRQQPWRSSSKGSGPSLSLHQPSYPATRYLFVRFIQTSLSNLACRFERHWRG